MRLTLAVFSGAVAAFLAVAALAQEPGTAKKPLRIGIGQSFFHDMKPALIETVTEPFITTMRDAANVTGELAIGGDPFSVARQLQGDKLHLGVFHGFEYAWVRRQFPELRPLVIAVNADQAYRALVVVRKDSPAMNFADLKGKDIALPRRTKEPVRRFLDAEIKRAGANGSNEFFARQIDPVNLETALDELSQGKHPAVATDAQGLEFYTDLKPGVAARLRVLARSEPFAPLVIAYHPGGLSDANLAVVQDTLTKAHLSEAGREVMTRWKITSFAPVPAELEKALAASLQAYPSPAKTERP